MLQFRTFPVVPSGFSREAADGSVAVWKHVLSLRGVGVGVVGVGNSAAHFGSVCVSIYMLPDI